MTQNKLKMPHNHKSDFKKEQVEALNEVRYHAIQLHERKFLNTNAIKEKVEAVSNHRFPLKKVSSTVFPISDAGYVCVSDQYIMYIDYCVY